MLLALMPIPLEPQLSLCGFLWLTGRPCPFCGITRGVSCLLKGDIALALTLHPLSPLALVALLTLFLGGLARIVSKKEAWACPPQKALHRFWVGSLVLFLAHGAWRIFYVGKHS